MVESVDFNSILFELDDFSKSCSSKKSYENEWYAKFAADETMAYNKHIKLHWYKCRYCGKWHLTEI